MVTEDCGKWEVLLPLHSLSCPFLHPPFFPSGVSQLKPQPRPCVLLVWNVTLFQVEEWDSASLGKVKIITEMECRDKIIEFGRHLDEYIGRHNAVLKVLLSLACHLQGSTGTMAFVTISFKLIRWLSLFNKYLFYTASWHSKFNKINIIYVTRKLIL